MARASSRGSSARSRFPKVEGRSETVASSDEFRPLATALALALALTDEKWAKNELLVILQSQA